MEQSLRSDVHASLTWLLPLVAGGHPTPSMLAEVILALGLVSVQSLAAFASDPETLVMQLLDGEESRPPLESSVRQAVGEMTADVFVRDDEISRRGFEGTSDDWRLRCDRLTLEPPPAGDDPFQAGLVLTGVRQLAGSTSADLHTCEDCRSLIAGLHPAGRLAIELTEARTVPPTFSQLLQNAELLAELTLPIDAYLHRRGWKLPPAKGTRQVYTHASIARGVYNIPWSSHDAFLRRLANSLVRRVNRRSCEVFGLVECHSSDIAPTFRLYFDLDLECYGDLSEPDWTEEREFQMLRAVQLAVAGCLDEHLPDRVSMSLTRCQVLRAPCKVSYRELQAKKRASGQDAPTGRQLVRKRAYHLIFRLPVDSPTALAVRELVLAALYDVCGPRQAHESSWEDSLDAGPLAVRGSLRMPFADKYACCTACGSASLAPVDCSICLKTRRVPEGRPYTPYRVLRGLPVNRARFLLEELKSPGQARECALCCTRTEPGAPTLADQMSSARDTLQEHMVQHNAYYALLNCTTRCSPNLPTLPFLFAGDLLQQFGIGRAIMGSLPTSSYIADSVRDGERQLQRREELSERARQPGVSDSGRAELQAVQSIIRSSCSPVHQAHYGSIVVSQLYRIPVRTGTADELDAIVRTPPGASIRLPALVAPVVGSKFCVHKNGAHAGNHIAFLISSDGGIWQVCYSEKICSEKTSTGHYRFLHPCLIGQADVSALFPSVGRPRASDAGRAPPAPTTSAALAVARSGVRGSVAGLLSGRR